MFKEPGRQLQTLAKFIFFVNLICGIIAGFAISAYSTKFLIVPFILCVVAGIILGWINSIMLYTFGGMASDLERTRTLLELWMQVNIDEMKERHSSSKTNRDSAVQL